jgi:hypothetical protein
MGALFFAFLTYGSLKRWRWVFWAYVLLLGGFVISALQFPSQSTLALLVDVISGVVGAVLFVVSLIGLIRFGLWGMKKAAAPLDNRTS